MLYFISETSHYQFFKSQLKYLKFHVTFHDPQSQKEFLPSTEIAIESL